MLELEGETGWRRRERRMRKKRMMLLVVGFGRKIDEEFQGKASSCSVRVKTLFIGVAFRAAWR